MGSFKGLSGVCVPMGRWVEGVTPHPTCVLLPSDIGVAMGASPALLYRPLSLAAVSFYQGKATLIDLPTCLRKQVFEGLPSGEPGGRRVRAAASSVV